MSISRTGNISLPGQWAQLPRSAPQSTTLAPQGTLANITARADLNRAKVLSINIPGGGSVKVRVSDPAVKAEIIKHLGMDCRNPTMTAHGTLKVDASSASLVFSRLAAANLLAKAAFKRVTIDGNDRETGRGYFFSRSDLKEAIFVGCKFKNVDFGASNVAGTKFSNCNFEGCTGMAMEGLNHLKLYGNNTVVNPRQNGIRATLYNSFFSAKSEKCFDLGDQINCKAKVNASGVVSFDAKGKDLRDARLAADSEIVKYLLRPNCTKIDVVNALGGMLYNEKTVVMLENGEVDKEATKRFQAVLNSVSVTRHFLPSRHSSNTFFGRPFVAAAAFIGGNSVLRNMMGLKEEDKFILHDGSDSNIAKLRKRWVVVGEPGQNEIMLVRKKWFSSKVEVAFFEKATTQTPSRFGEHYSLKGVEIVTDLSELQHQIGFMRVKVNEHTARHRTAVQQQNQAPSNNANQNPAPSGPTNPANNNPATPATPSPAGPANPGPTTPTPSAGPNPAPSQSQGPAAPQQPIAPPAPGGSIQGNMPPRNNP